MVEFMKECGKTGGNTAKGSTKEEMGPGDRECGKTVFP